MKTNYSKRWLLTGIGLMLITLVMLFATNPQSLPIGVLVVPSILMFTGLACILYSLLAGLVQKRSKRLLYAFGGSGLPVFLILLKSIDQLTFKDVILVLGLSVLSGFYVSRLRFRANR